MPERPSGLPDGAEEVSAVGFNRFVGPFYRLPDTDAGATKRFAFVIVENHMNAGGSVHGGVLMTFADMAMSQTARAGTTATGGNTVALNCDFVGPGRLGDVVEARVRVTRRARTMVFLSGEIVAQERLLLVASGLWKIVAPS